MCAYGESVEKVGQKVTDRMSMEQVCSLDLLDKFSWLFQKEKCHGQEEKAP